jgi:hypothetical protein
LALQRQRGHHDRGEARSRQAVDFMLAKRKCPCPMKI